MPKLTDAFLKTFRPAAGAKDRLTFDTVCRGLGVRATASGNRVFIVQWTDAATGRKQREPLGVWGSITVEQARTAARAQLGRVAQGVNPIAERAKAKAEDVAAKIKAYVKDLASQAVTSKIKGLVDGEDVERPPSDQKIVELLKKGGIDIARRTGAKYHEQRGILSSSKRKQVF